MLPDDPRIHKDCYRALNETIKNQTYRYITFILSEKVYDFILVEKKAEREYTLEDLFDDLPPNQCRYVFYDYDFVDKNGKLRRIPIFIHWIPDACPIRMKMHSVRYKQEMHREIKNVIGKDSLIYIEAEDENEIVETEIQLKCSRYIENLK